MWTRRLSPWARTATDGHGLGPVSATIIPPSKLDEKRNADVDEHAEKAPEGRQGLRQRLACDPQWLLGRDHGAVWLGQRHRGHAAWRAGLPFDGRLLPGDGQASGDAAGARAVE